MVHMYTKINTEYRLETMIIAKLFVDSYELFCCWLSFISSINELLFFPEWINDSLGKQIVCQNLPQTFQKKLWIVVILCINYC